MSNRIKAFQIDTVDLAADSNMQIGNIGLDNIVDVTLTAGSPLLGSPAAPHADNELLSFDADTNQWINKTIPLAGVQALSTGSFDGGEILVGTPDGSPLLGSPPVSTRFTVTAGSGIIVDSYTDPENPTFTRISWDEQTNVDLEWLGDVPITYIAIDVNGAIHQSTTAYTVDQHRDYIVLGRVGHVNNTNIAAVRSNTHGVFDTSVRLADLAEAIGSFNITGNTYNNTLGDLTISKTIGESYRLGNNFQINKKSPDITSDAGNIGVIFKYSYQNGIGGFVVTADTTLIDTNNYDDDGAFNGPGTLRAMPVNQWQVQIIKFFPGKDPIQRIEYGQTTYGTKAAAIAAIPDFNHEHNEIFAEGIVRSYLVVAQGATLLNDLAQAEFIEAGRFGASGAVGSTGGHVFTSSFESGEIDVALNNDHVAIHGLGVVPAGSQAFLRCISPELGYEVNTEVEFLNYDGSVTYKGLHSDSVDIHWVAGPNIAVTVHAGSPGTGTMAIITPANWKIILRAYA